MDNQSCCWHLLLAVPLLLASTFVIPSFSILAAPAEVIKSATDNRAYEGFVLSNGLRVLAISDPTTNKAAVAMDVAVGSAHDPEQREGLVHFLEHMLFLGTKKYPQAGEYKQFITTHGGKHNAYTAFENTNYFFDIESRYLAPALDRFAQFFLAPSFSPGYVEREKHAVHAEYRANLRSNSHRALDAKKQVVNPEHPFSRFSTGNLQTLAERPSKDIRGELISFYNKHYSADRMALVVLGKEPIPVLRAWISKTFMAIPRRTLRTTSTVGRPPLFKPGDLPLKLYVTPVGARRSLSLTFPIPSKQRYFREKPTSYLASLIGHEGEGSLLSALRRAGWAFGIQAGSGLDHENEATFDVSIQLSEIGKFHVDDIVKLFFQYVQLIKSHGIASWIFKEQQRIAEIKFRFQNHPEPIVYVRRLALNLQRYPLSEVIRGRYTMPHYNPQVIAKYLRFLRPDNLLLTILADGLHTDSLSPWFKAEYRVEKVGADEMQKWQTPKRGFSLSLPSPNLFLPEDLSLKAVTTETEVPKLLQQDEGYELWYRQDHSDNHPRANFYLTVRSPMANDSPLHAALAKLYVATVKDRLTEFLYPARRAGLQYTISHHIRGFVLRLSGYNDKQHVFLARIVEELQNPFLEPTSFERIKTTLVRELSNKRRRKPYHRGVSELPSLLVRPHWSEEEQIAAMRAVRVKDLQAFVPNLLAQISLVALAHGNLARADAIALGDIVKAGLWQSATPAKVPNGRVVKLAAGDEFIRQIEINHPDSALALYFQGSSRDARVTAQYSLLRQIIAAPFYHDLRTERQLGYVVFSALTSLLGTPGITFVVQSPTTDPGSLETQVENFISHYENALAAMSLEEFESYKTGLLTRILTKAPTLQERTDRYWDAMNRLQYQFNWRKRLAAAIRSITKLEFEKFYRRSLLSGRRKRLAIHCVGTSHRSVKLSVDKDLKRTFIEDPRLFIKDREYFSKVLLPVGVPAVAATGRGCRYEAECKGGSSLYATIFLDAPVSPPPWFSARA